MEKEGCGEVFTLSHAFYVESRWSPGTLPLPGCYQDSRYFLGIWILVNLAGIPSQIRPGVQQEQPVTSR